MPEVSPVSPQTAERPVLGNVESLKGLTRENCLRLSLILTAKLAKAGGVLKNNDHVSADEQYLKAKLTEQGREVDKEVLVDPDELWRAVHIIYPPKEADLAYHTIRTSECALLLDKPLPDNWDAKRIHEELKEGGNGWLAYLNKRQLINGEFASLKLFNQTVKELRAVKASSGTSRRRFLQVAAVGGGATLTAKLILDRLPTQPPLNITTAIPTKVKPTEIPKEESTLTPTPEPTPKPPEDLFTEFIKPFVEEALRKRAERAKNNPEYSHRVDAELNQNRVNILLLGYGEEHGDTYADYAGPITVLSYDLKTKQITSISFSRDMRAPELERKSTKEELKATPIRYSFRNGGFDSTRQIVEDATGLAVDFQIVFKDKLIHNLITDLAGNNLDINVPKELQTTYFRFDDKQHSPVHFSASPQSMNADKAMYYIVGEHESPQVPEDERTFRKNIVLKALSKKIMNEIKNNPLRMVNVLQFILSKTGDKSLITDIDQNLFTSTLNGIFNSARNALLSPASKELKIPELNENNQININDPMFGGEGVKRVHNINEGDHPSIQEDYKNGVMEKWMLIPPGGNPYGDLVDEYWKPVRNIIKGKLLRKAVV